MKGFAYLAGALLICGTCIVNAQITINNSHIGVAGNLLSQNIDTSPDSLIQAGGKGSGMTWDFSALQEDETDVMYFLSPTGLPAANDFPTANLAITYDLEDSTWIYLNNSASELNVLGFVSISSFGPFTDTTSASYNFKILEFPSTLNSMFNSASQGFSSTSELGVDPDAGGPHPTVDSLRVKVSNTISSDIDAEGIVMMPDGNYNALRQYLFVEQTDSIFMFANGTWSLLSNEMEMFLGSPAVESYNTESYRWWTDDTNVGFPLVEFDINGELKTLEGDVTWVSPVMVAIDKNRLEEFTVYPNPTSGLLNVKLGTLHNEGLVMNIFDISGKEVASFRISGTQQQLSLEGLNNGMYFYRLITSDGKPLFTGKLNLQQ